MNTSEPLANSEPAAESDDVAEFSKQVYFTILLDENLRVLEAGLEDDGFKVIMPPAGMTDEAIKRMARGWAILTRNTNDFLNDAVRLDYDVIGVEDVKFLDGRQDRTNEAVRKISLAVRRSRIGTRRGNFFLKIRDNGSYHLRQLL